MVQPSNRKRNRKKLQSAMEYLTTYGWAVLVIMIVLVVLFKLGVFSSGNYGPRATPGSCWVSRPNGPYSNIFMKLQGVCNGELPQYVALFNGVQFSYVSANVLGINTTSGGHNTVSFWLFWNGQSSVMPFSLSSYDLYGSLTCFGFNTHSSDIYGTSLPGSSVSNAWVFITAIFYNGAYTNNDILYLNGVPQTLSQCAGTATSGTAGPIINIGSYIGQYYGVTGKMANIQIYNTSLSANEIQAQYVRGIGGAPIRPQNLAGWWPLNGDTNDYSGNGNTGVPTNVVFTTSWTSGYTVP